MRTHAALRRVSVSSLLLVVLAFALFLSMDGRVRSATLIMIEEGDTWQYQPGTAPLPADWNTAGFDASSWAEGPSGFGFGDGDDATVLADMVGNYSSLAIRRVFGVDPDTVAELRLETRFDDGYACDLNGVEVASSGVDDRAFSATATQSHEADNDPHAVDIDPALLQDGPNVLACQVFNRSLGSSDLSLIPVLSATLHPEDPGDPPVDPDGCDPELLEREPHEVAADLRAAYAAEDWDAYACNYAPDAFVIDDQGILLGRSEIVSSAISFKNIFCDAELDVQEENLFQNTVRTLFQLDNGWVVIPDGVFTFNIEGGEIVSQTTHGLIEFTGPPPEGGYCGDEPAD